MESFNTTDVIREANKNRKTNRKHFTKAKTNTAMLDGQETCSSLQSETTKRPR